MTYHYVAAEFVNPATDVPRGLFITRTTNWGKNWVTPDSSIKNVQESTPVIAIDWSTTPDSLCLAFTPVYGSESRNPHCPQFDYILRRMGNHLFGDQDG